MKLVSIKRFLLICLFTACVGAATYQFSEYQRIREVNKIITTDLNSTNLSN